MQFHVDDMNMFDDKLPWTIMKKMFYIGHELFKSFQGSLKSLSNDGDTMSGGVSDHLCGGFKGGGFKHNSLVILLVLKT